MKLLKDFKRLLRLQQQLNALKQKAFKLSRLIPGSDQGLIDSGATHALRPEDVDEETKNFKEVQVDLANGSSVVLKMNSEGVMVTSSPRVEPIVPMGVLVEELRCRLDWSPRGLQVHHPVRGVLPVYSTKRLSSDPRTNWPWTSSRRSGVLLKEMKIGEEQKWLRDLVEGHPEAAQPFEESSCS